LGSASKLSFVASFRSTLESREIMRTWVDRVASSWVGGAFYSACVLIALAPLLLLVWQPTVVLIFLHFPAYMLHQVEEHQGDAFRTFVNARLFGGKEALTTSDILWINLPGVWGPELVAIYAAAIGGASWGLFAPYLALVNAAAHIVAAILLRSWNPGLGTAIFLFAPLGAVTLAATTASATEHAVGLGAALFVHAAAAARIFSRAAEQRS
jgi:hypothetical protein